MNGVIELIISSVDDILTFVSASPLTAFNTAILIFTAVLSYSTRTFQVRTSIRESIEQLEDVELRSGKLRPILYRFNYAIGGRSTCSVQLKYYKDGRNPASANQPMRKSFFGVVNKIIRGVLDEHPARYDINFGKFEDQVAELISGVDGVKNVKNKPNGIIIQIDSGDAVEIRRITEEVLEEIYRTLVQRSEDVLDDLAIDVDEITSEDCK